MAKTSESIDEVLAYLGNVSSSSSPVDPYSVAIPVGAAGVLVNFSLKHRPICNLGGTGIGGGSDSSLDIDAGTAFTTLVGYKEDADLANGEYYVDHLTGKGRGRKADNTTSMSWGYSIFALQTGSGSSAAAGTVAATNSAGGTATATNSAGGTQVVIARATRASCEFTNDGSVDGYYGAGTVTSSFQKILPGQTKAWNSQEALKVLSSGADIAIRYIDYYN